MKISSKIFSKKKGIKTLSLVLMCCLIVSMVGPHYVKAQELQSSAFLATGVELSDEASGVKVTYANAAEWWQRASTVNMYDTAQGIHVEITDIKVADNADYSFAIAIGNGDPMTGGTNQWSDKAGYMLVYGKSGHFEIFPTAGVNTAPIAHANTKLVSVEREPLSGSVSMDLKLNGDSFVITVNGDTYTIPTTCQDSSKKLVNPTKLYLAFGVLGGTDTNTGDAKWETSLGAGTSFVIADVSGAYQEPVTNEVEWDSAKIFASEQANCNVDCNYVLEDDTEKGMKVTHSSNTAFYARVNATTLYSAEKGVHMEIADISCPSDSDYSIGVSIGNTADQWYDKAGYMIVYGNTGDFSIVATGVGGNITTGNSLVSVVREPLNGQFSMDIRIIENDYVITVNGKAYVIPTVNQKAALSDVKNLYMGVGIMPGGPVASMDLLKTYSDATFTIKQITDEVVVGLKEEFGYARTKGITLASIAEGVKVSYAEDSVAYADFVQTIETYDAMKGVHLEIKDIAATTENASFAIAFGNAEEQWYGQPGYVVKYEMEGLCEIIPTGDDEALLSIKREPLGTTLTMDLKLVDSDYVITVNGDTYTIPATYTKAEKAILDTANLRFGFGIPEAGGASFLITEVSDLYMKPIIESVDMTNESNFKVDDASYKEECNYVLEEKNGVKVSHSADTVFYSRVNTKTTRNTKDGIRIQIGNISSPSDEDYSVAVALGNGSDQWYDKTGYMLVYSKDGNFEIVATSGNTGTHIQHGEIMVSVKREALTDSLDIDIKLQNGDYVITVNGDVYTIPAEHHIYPIGDIENLYVGIGMMDGGKVKELELLKQLADATFTISHIYSKVDITDDKPEEDTRNPVPPQGMDVEGTSFRFEETKSGLTITHVETGAAWERVYYEKPYSVEENGLTLELENIVSDAENYSLVIGVGANGPVWYDKQGCMILYGKSGNLAIIAPSGVAPEESTVENPNDAKVLASNTIKKYQNSFSLNVKMQGKDYVFTINGEEYLVEGKYLGNSDQIYLSLGIMSDYTLEKGDISNLKYFEDDFKNKDVSFTIVKVEAQEIVPETFEGNAIKPEEAGMKAESSNIILQKVENGLKVIHTAKAAGWERVVYNNAYNPMGNGIHVEIDDITSKASNYSLVVKIGSKGSWYDTRGYMVIYGKSGNFSIVATDGSITNPNVSPVLVSEVREALGETYNLDVKLKGTNYEITVNGKTYKVPVQHTEYPIENPKELYLAFGVMSDGKLGEIDYFGNEFKKYAVTFVLANTSGVISAENQGKPYGMHAYGYNWKLEKTSNGTKVTQGVGGTGWEHVSMEEPYKTTEGGLQIEIKDIQSKESNYSIAVMIGNDQAPWYDTTGYMMIYGKSGNFAIIATDATVINPNKSPIVVSEVREELGKTLSINVRLMDDGENYAITVNDKVYTIPAEHEDFELKYTDTVYVSFGLMSDGEIGNLIYSDEYKKGETSFTIASVYHSDKDVVDVFEPEEEPNEEETEREDKTQEDNSSKEPVNATGIIIGGVSAALLMVIVIVLVVLKAKKKRVGGEA